MTQSEELLEYTNGATCFHDLHGSPYISFEVSCHHETWPVRSRAVRMWLTRCYYLQHRKPPSTQAIENVLRTLEAQAQFDGAQQRVFIRIGEHMGGVCLDLGDSAWRAVQIRPGRWDCYSTTPVKMIRSQESLPLPEPERGAFLSELRPFLNVSSEDDFILLVAFILGCYSPKGPYPVLNLVGEQGTAKTTTSRVISHLVDPREPHLRSLPRSERDLMIQARNSWLLAYDNLSRIPQDISDALCRVSTGGGFATRTHYSNDSETIFSATRPILLNGIDPGVTKFDLVDRSIVIELPEIPDDRRLPEAEFWYEFDRARPRILGAVLDAVTTSLRNRDQVKLESTPRMADFARWVTAAEFCLPWKPDEFIQAYRRNRRTAVMRSLDRDPVAKTILEAVCQHGDLEGTMADILVVLEKVASASRRRGLPRSETELSKRITRAKPFLRNAGVIVEKRDAKTRRGYMYRILESQRNAGDASDAGTTGGTGDSKSDSVEDGCKPASPASPEYAPEKKIENCA